MPGIELNPYGADLNKMSPDRVLANVLPLLMGGGSLAERENLDPKDPTFVRQFRSELRSQLLSLTQIEQQFQFQEIQMLVSQLRQLKEKGPEWGNLFENVKGELGLVLTINSMSEEWQGRAVVAEQLKELAADFSPHHFLGFQNCQPVEIAPWLEGVVKEGKTPGEMPMTEAAFRSHYAWSFFGQWSELLDEEMSKKEKELAGVFGYGKKKGAEEMAKWQKEIDGYMKDLDWSQVVGAKELNEEVLDTLNIGANGSIHPFVLEKLFFTHGPIPPPEDMPYAGEYAINNNPCYQKIRLLVAEVLGNRQKARDMGVPLNDPSVGKTDITLFDLLAVKDYYKKDDKKPIHPGAMDVDLYQIRYARWLFAMLSSGSEYVGDLIEKELDFFGEKADMNFLGALKAWSNNVADGAWSVLAQQNRSLSKPARAGRALKGSVSIVTRLPKAALGTFLEVLAFNKNPNLPKRIVRWNPAKGTVKNIDNPTARDLLLSGYNIYEAPWLERYGGDYRSWKFTLNQGLTVQEHFAKGLELEFGNKDQETWRKALTNIAFCYFDWKFGNDRKETDRNECAKNVYKIAEDMWSGAITQEHYCCFCLRCFATCPLEQNLVLLTTKHYQYRCGFHQMDWKIWCCIRPSLKMFLP